MFTYPLNNPVNFTTTSTPVKCPPGEHCFCLRTEIQSEWKPDKFITHKCCCNCGHQRAITESKGPDA